MTDTSFSPGITISRIVLMVGAVLTLIGTIGLPIVEWVSHDPLEWTGRVANARSLPADLAGPSDGVRLAWDGTAAITLEDPTARDRLMALLPGAVAGGAIVAVLLLLIGLLNRIQAGSPFVPASVRTLRIIAVVIALAGAVVPILDMAASTHIVGTAVADASSPPPTAFLNFAWFAVALLLYSLAEAFAHGVRMARDVEGLV